MKRMKKEQEERFEKNRVCVWGRRAGRLILEQRAGQDEGQQEDGQSWQRKGQTKQRWVWGRKRPRKKPF